jgi:DNA-binding NtrC family response regulator
LESKELNLLVIDDSSSIRTMLKRLLKNHFKFVKVVESSTAGIREAQKGEFDIILTDWECPECDGANKVINSVDIPVVIMTGNITRKHSVNKVIYKPFEIEYVISSIVEVYNSKNK